MKKKIIIINLKIEENKKKTENKNNLTNVKNLYDKIKKSVNTGEK